MLKANAHSENRVAQTRALTLQKYLLKTFMLCYIDQNCIFLEFINTANELLKYVKQN